MQDTIVEFGVSLPAVSDSEIDRDDLLFRSKLIHSIPPGANEEFAISGARVSTHYGMRLALMDHPLMIKKETG